MWLHVWCETKPTVPPLVTASISAVIAVRLCCRDFSLQMDAASFLKRKKKRLNEEKKGLCHFIQKAIKMIFVIKIIWKKKHVKGYQNI